MEGNKSQKLFKKKLRIFFLVVLVLSLMKQIEVEVEGLSLLTETTAPPSPQTGWDNQMDGSASC